MTFRQFAFNNVTRNMRTYMAYFLSSAFSVMIFFVYAMFILHPGIVHESFGYAQTGMTVAEYIIYIFSFFFVFYSVSAFLKTRKKEFGVLMMHGMTKQQLNWLVFLENMIIGIGSILTGIIAGVILSNLFLLIVSKALYIPKLPFYWPWQAAGITVVAFLVLFFIISLFTALFVRSNRLIELLRGSAKPKQEPKASIFLAFLSAVLLLTGYMISFIVKGVAVIMAMIPVVIIVIIGTYFLFSQLSVWVIRLLKRNRSIYWRKTNLIAISDLAYRMKDNTRIYFIVAIVSTVTICALGTFAGFQEAIETDMKRSNPFAISYVSSSANPYEKEHTQLIKEALQKADLEFTVLQADGMVWQTNEITGESRAVVALSDFNRFSDALGYAPEQLADNEVLHVKRSSPIGPVNQVEQEPEQEVRFTESAITLQVQKQLQREVFPFSFISGYDYYVVADEVFTQLNGTKSNSVTVYDVANWKDTIELSKRLEEQIGYDAEYSFSALGVDISFVRELYSLLMFVGIFITIVFFVATGSFLYFRLYTDLAEDRKQYQAIAKLGLSEQELSRIATTQVALLFYAPFIVAALHSAVALYALHSFFNLSILKSAALVIGGFFAAQTLYFLLIRSRYVKHLKEAIR